MFLFYLDRARLASLGLSKNNVRKVMTQRQNSGCLSLLLSSAGVLRELLENMEENIGSSPSGWTPRAYPNATPRRTAFIIDPLSDRSGGLGGWGWEGSHRAYRLPWIHT